MKKRVKEKFAEIAFMETAEWWRGNQIASARPLVQILAQFEKGNPSHYPYSTFVNSASFTGTLKHFNNRYGIRFIHVACHGNGKGLVIGDGVDEETVSQTVISNSIKGKTTFLGLFISVCDSNDMAMKIAKSHKQVWISGYSKSVDWLDSTAFEILFWQKVIKVNNRKRRRNQPELTNKEKILQVLRELKQDGYEGVINNLGLHVYFKERNKIDNLCDSI